MVKQPFRFVYELRPLWIAVSGRARTPAGADAKVAGLGSPKPILDLVPWRYLNRIDRNADRFRIIPLAVVFFV